MILHDFFLAEIKRIPFISPGVPTPLEHFINVVKMSWMGQNFLPHHEFLKDFKDNTINIVHLVQIKSKHQEYAEYNTHNMITHRTILDWYECLVLIIYLDYMCTHMATQLWVGICEQTLHVICKKDIDLFLVFFLHICHTYLHKIVTSFMQHECYFQVFKILIALEMCKLLNIVICRLLLSIYSNCIVRYKVIITSRHN